MKNLSLFISNPLINVEINFKLYMICGIEKMN